MSYEALEQDQEIVGLKGRVDELLAKAKEHMIYMESFDQVGKKAHLDNMGHQAPQLMKDSYQNVEDGKRILGDMIRNLESAKESLDRGNKNISPVKTVRDVLNEELKVWNREFVPPVRD